MESNASVAPNAGDMFDTPAIIAILERQEYELLGYNGQMM